ncbi:DUF4145 domain-containing protein [Aeromonas veronii]|uniref:DUF4145 domain-containing protein n=1 Tax=Aeromonas veronii TaxID=654 RepID=UPI003C6F2C1D
MSFQLNIPNLPPLFEAIRLFGNDGSHPGSKITRHDVMDAYGLIEHVLQVLYKPVPKLPTEIVEKITKKIHSEAE